VLSCQQFILSSNRTCFFEARVINMNTTPIPGTCRRLQVLMHPSRGDAFSPQGCTKVPSGYVGLIWRKHSACSNNLICILFGVSETELSVLVSDLGM